MSRSQRLSDQPHDQLAAFFFCCPLTIVFHLWTIFKSPATSEADPKIVVGYIESGAMSLNQLSAVFHPCSGRCVSHVKHLDITFNTELFGIPMQIKLAPVASHRSNKSVTRDKRLSARWQGIRHAPIPAMT